jgi:sugar phosphate isomerase/epimerase
MLVEAVQSLGLPGVGFNIDTGHAVLHGMTPADAIRLMGPLLLTTHLQDNLGKQDDHLPPGRGGIDWPGTLAALREVKYKGMLMVEISDCPPGREPDAAADTRAAFENLSRFARAAAGGA